MSINVRQESKLDDGNSQESHLQKRSPADLTSPSALSSNSAEEGGLDIGRFMGAIWILPIVTILIMGTTFAWSRSKKPAYEGSFKILIEPVTAEGQVVSALKGTQTTVEEQDLGGAQSSKTTLDYPTQIQILLSEKLLGPVIQQLKPAYPKTSYEMLKNSLSISRLKDAADTKILEVQYRSGSERETTKVLNLVSRAYVQYSFSERQTNVRRAVQFVDSQLPKVQAQVLELELALQKFRERHQLIDPTTMGTQLGARMSNTQQEQLTAQVELAKTKQLYRALEQQLQMQPKGAEAASVLSDAPGYQQLVKQLQELDVELKIQSAQLTDEHPKIVLLQEKRRKLLPLLQEQANTILGSKLFQGTTNTTSLPYQNALRQDLSKQFIAAATQIQVLEVKLNRLNEASQALAVQTGQLPIVSRQYENLQRQLKIATEQLSKFSQKREELMINAARQEVPWELIASPSIDKVSSVNLAKDLVLGSIVGLMLGTGLALIMEAMNDVIYSLKDLREEIKIAILGMIPDREDEQKSLNNSQPKQDKKRVSSLITEEDEIIANNRYRFSPFIESFRALNSQIRLLSPDAPIRSLVVSSSLPDEGKTTIAIQLAQAAAAMGQRVLLVNADLRKPSLQTLTAEHDRHDLIHGLTDAIVGSVELMDIVQLLPGEENLYILLSGSVALDPTSLLSSKKMRDLMRKCEDNFDLVIYDTVPLNFADSLLLIPHTDGLLMVTRLGKIHREVLRNSLRTLEISKVAVLGLVVNMISASPSSIEVYRSYGNK
jgi:polysaccharide biosynthesis transport protein